MVLVPWWSIVILVGMAMPTVFIAIGLILEQAGLLGPMLEKLGKWLDDD